MKPTPKKLLHNRSSVVSSWFGVARYPSEKKKTSNCCAVINHHTPCIVVRSTLLNNPCEVYDPATLNAGSAR